MNSDPSIIYYTENFSTLKETSSADWQQQGENTPFRIHDLDH